MTASAPPSARAGHGAGSPGRASGPARPLVITGAIAACAAAGTGLVLITLLVLAGWIAAPHAGLGLPGVLRTAADLWLVGHHVGFTLHRHGRGAGQDGAAGSACSRSAWCCCPARCSGWPAGGWSRRARCPGCPRSVTRRWPWPCPYALLAGALALLGQSSLATPSLAQAVLSGFLLALVAGGLGGARALAPWWHLVHLLPPRSRSVFLGSLGALTVLTGAGAILAGASLGTHLSGFRAADVALAPGSRRRRAAAPHPDRICA